MEERFYVISMWSALGAFVATMILVHIAITIARCLEVHIWRESPPSPGSVVTALSDEDKEKIEKLRSSAILRHLSKFTTILKEENMVTLTSPTATEEKSNKCCILAENSIIDEEEQQSLQVDLEKGTLNNNDTAHHSHICVPLPGQQSCEPRTNDTDNTSEITNLTNDIPETRNVPNLCIICHDEYELSDKVCWASSSDCTHVFHEECIVRWLTSLGWMKLKEHKQPESMIEEEKCLNYDLECPMCRGHFICKENVSKSAPVVVVVAGAGEESV